MKTWARFMFLSGTYGWWLKQALRRHAILAGVTLAMLPLAVAAQEPFALNLRNEAGKVRLSWPSGMADASGGVVFPEFTVERSTDLQNWTPLRGRIRAQERQAQGALSLLLDAAPGTAYYRVAADPLSTAVQQTGAGGEEVFGLGAQLKEELGKVGWLTVESFAAANPQPAYLEAISWDPRTAAYWDECTRSNSQYNLQLNTRELAIMLTNGFVVSERLKQWSFGSTYDFLFTQELPAFITADSVLHAWHRGYRSMLAELETLQLSTTMETVLTTMHRKLPALHAQHGSGPLANSILDADYYLTVALSLWANKQVGNALPGEAQKARVTTTLQNITALQLTDTFLFGPDSPRTVDFSQFKVRSYYTLSERLQRYFRAMMWCGRIDLKLVTFPPDQEDTIRQFGTALVLHQLLKQAGQFDNWRTIDQVIRAFVGVTDSMTFDQLDQLLTDEHIASLSDVPNLQVITSLQTRLLSGELGAQAYASEGFVSPLSGEQARLPRSFTVMGQKFIVDGWAHSQVVYDRVLWPAGDSEIPEKVQRRKTSCLDAAYAVLANDQVVPNLVERMTNVNGMPFRDGLPYQHNLQAIRNVVDAMDPSVWEANLYTAWLGALRELSKPTVDPCYPEAMRTRAWAMRTLNAQMGSWTELRHDTLLYAKQPSSGYAGCGYPDGFVEPRPAFWLKMQHLAAIASDAITRINLSGTVTNYYPVDLAMVRSNQLAFLREFSASMGMLASISEKELAQQPLNAAETEFLQDIIIIYGGYGRVEIPMPGWYRKLFYQNHAGIDFGLFNSPDPLVADVYTDMPDPWVGDPGGVLHEAVGYANWMLIAIDNGPDRTIYAGPVYSHYEFYEPGLTRLTDEQWQSRLWNKKPASPEWTMGWLVPGQ